MKLRVGMIAAGLLVAACSANPANTGQEEVVETPAEEAVVAAPPAESAPADPLAAPADVAAAPGDAITTPTGLASKVLMAGTGTERPMANSQVRVHYTGWTTDGQRFDSSVERGEPLVFPLNKVIKGWTEGLQLMVTGEKRRFWIPAELAYAHKPDAPQGTLVFDVELLEILPPAE